MIHDNAYKVNATKDERCKRSINRFHLSARRFIDQTPYDLQNPDNRNIENTDF